MVVGQLVDHRGIHFAPDAIELQLAVDVLAENVLEASGWGRWVKPGIVTGPIEKDRLSIVQLLHRLAGGLRNDGAACDVEVGIVGPKTGEGEGAWPGW